MQNRGALPVPSSQEIPPLEQYDKAVHLEARAFEVDLDLFQLQSCLWPSSVAALLDFPLSRLYI